MKHEIPHELFSAYLDGEVTAEERARVEALLESSEEARRYLSDLKQVSQELQELSREELPDEFPGMVRAAVEREMLLPAAESNTGPPGDRTGVSAWLRSGVVLAATAAVLLLTLSLLDLERPTTRLTSPDGNSEEERSESLGDRSRVAENKRSEKLAAHREEEDETRRPGKNRPVNKTRNGKTLQKLAAGTGAAMKRAYREPLVPPVDGVNRANASTGSKRLVFVDDVQNLTRDDVGRVLTAMEHSRSGISVVKLTVIDCRRGLDALQVLFARNRIHLQPNTTPDDERTKDVSEKKRDGQKMVAVYVQSTSDRLASAVADLKIHRQFRRLQVDPPISPANLDRSLRNQIAMVPGPRETKGLTKRRFRLSAGFRGKKNSAVRTPGANGTAPSKKKADTKSDGKRDPKADAGKQAGPGDSVDELDRISRQLQLKIPADLLRRNSGRLIARRKPSQPDRGSKRGGSGVTSADGDQTGKPAPGNADRPLRVLFVLVCNSQPPADAKKRPKSGKPKKTGSPRS